MDKQKILNLQCELMNEFETIRKATQNIRIILERYADGKVLKGDEIVGWLGEIYGKLLFNGRLVGDENEHDFETTDGKRISVKTRKGYGSGWNNTSAIPKIKGEDCPTHLMFIHLDDDYTVAEIWLYPWDDLLKNNRFKVHKVRGAFRSYRFRVNVENDYEYLIYKK